MPSEPSASGTASGKLDWPLRLAVAFVIVVASCFSGPDSREEDVRRPVLRLRRSQRKGGGETTSEPGEPLVLAHPVVDKRSVSKIGGAGDVRLLPGCATIVRVGEPDVGRQGGVARHVVTEVVPHDAHGAVLVDCDSRLERERANARQGLADPGETTVQRPDHSDRA